MGPLASSDGGASADSYADSAATDLSSASPTTYCNFCETDYDTESAYHDNYQHAKESYHSRCFVPGCDSVYAKEDWDDKDIVKHVGEEHDDEESDSD
ncbi:MAG: hypothetical protein Q9162_005822 [Coniocarpon cinnabarinum]